MGSLSKRSSWVLKLMSIVFIVLGTILMTITYPVIERVLNGEARDTLLWEPEIISQTLSVIICISPFLFALLIFIVGIIGIIYPSRKATFICGYTQLAITVICWMYFEISDFLAIKIL